jgi:hypothetical protein
MHFDPVGSVEESTMTVENGRRSRNCTGSRLPVTRLNDDDMSIILESAGLSSKIDADVKTELKQLINCQIERMCLGQQRRRENPPHQKLDGLREIQEAADALLRAINDYGGVELELARAADLNCDYLLPVDRQHGTLDARDVDTSELAIVTVETACRAIELIRFLASSCETTVRQFQAELGTKQRPKQPDYIRYSFIIALGKIYQRIFRVEPTTTVDSEWFLFLAEVLSRCDGQGRAISVSNARDLFMKARKWVNDPASGEVRAKLRDTIDGIPAAKDALERVRSAHPEPDTSIAADPQSVAERTRL